MKNIKITLFLIISFIGFSCFNNNVYAAEATKCVYKNTHGAEYTVTLTVTPNGKGSATLGEVKMSNNYQLSENYITASNFIKDNKLSCPSKLYHQVGASNNYRTTIISLSFVKSDLSKPNANPMELTDSTNNNQSLTSENNVTLIRDCKFSGVNIVGGGSVGELKIKAYSDGSLEYEFSNNKYIIKADDSVTSSDFSKSCPSYYVGCGCDGSNCFCTVTEDNIVNPDQPQPGDDVEDGEDIQGDAEYSCSYTGQIGGKTLKIVKYAEEWNVTYPNGTTKTIPTNSVGSNVMPSSNCEDVFYTESNDSIKAIQANTAYTSSHISQFCASYDDLEQFCANGTCKITSVPCGSSSGTNQYGNCPTELAPIIAFLKKVVINTLKIFVPIILIIMATLDLVKAVMATDEKSMQEALPRIIRRFLAAVLMFFVTTIVVIVLDMFATSGVGQYNEWKACWTNLD